MSGEADRHQSVSLVKTQETYKLQLLRLQPRKLQYLQRYSEQGIPKGLVIESREINSSTSGQGHLSCVQAKTRAPLVLNGLGFSLPS